MSRDRRRGRALAVAFVLTSLGAPRDPDPWFGRDKALHFSASAAIALGGYGASSFKTTEPLTRAAVGATLGLGAGIAKELADLGGAGDASWRDLTWDVIGTATGVLLASAIDWMIRRTCGPAPRPSNGESRY
jgi:putative lipoprotein